MCCGVRVFLAPALAAAALLRVADAGSSVSEIEHLDWMHISKTGSTFGFALVMRECEDLEEVLASPKFDEDTGRTMERLKALQAMHLGEKMSCGTHATALPLAHAEAEGHEGWPVSSVVTLLRSPFSRAASGFVHNFHDCEAFRTNSKKKVMRASLCRALLEGPNTTDYERAVEHVLRYGRCVEDCTTRMITGESCGQYPFPELTEKQVVYRLERALRKLDQFGFVGLTERWAESLCLFSKLFPRPSGKPYPDFLLSKNRLTPDRSCEMVVEQVLRSGGGGYTESSDKIVFARAVELFERALAGHPECKA